MDMNLFRKSLASKTQQLDETTADSADGLIYGTLETLSMAIESLFLQARKGTLSKEASDTARQLANELSIYYDKIQRAADKNLKKLE